MTNAKEDNCTPKHGSKAQQHLDVLKLRANGQQRERMLELKLQLQQQIKAIADAQGIAQGKAIDQLGKVTSKKNQIKK